MKRLRFLVLFVLGVLLLSAPAAGVPRLVNYQGVLTDTGDIPLDGSYDLRFSIYPDSLVATPSIWTELHTGVDVDDGLFNVILGSIADLPDSIFAGGERWMGIAVDADPEMRPRMQITSVPWAIRAATADSALASGADSDWVISGDDMYSAPSGYVGIGTPSPDKTLHVVSSDLSVMEIEGTRTGSWAALTINGSSGGNPCVEYMIDGSYAAKHFVSYPGYWRLDLGPDCLLYAEPINDFVGVGTITPQEKLDVDGAVRVGTTSNTNAGTIRWTGTDFEGYDGGTWLSLTGSGSGAMPPGSLGQTLRHNGSDWVVSDFLFNEGDRIGIGTTGPSAELEVVGDNMSNHFKLTALSGAGPALYLNAVNKDWTIYGSNPTSSAGDRKLVFRDYTAFTDRMVIDENGRVGIGELNPAATLHVAGGNDDLTSTEGDFKIGNVNYRLKMGVSTSGLDVGTARVQVDGGLSALRLGVEYDDLLSLLPYGEIEFGCSTRTAYVHLLHEGWDEEAMSIFSNANGGAIQMLDEAGGRLVSLMGNSSGYGGSLILWSDDASPGILAHANTDGLGNPEIYIQGSSNTALFSMQKDDDSTVILPVSSISAIEMFNEPAVASDGDGTSVILLDGTVETLLSRSMNLPAPGYVHVIATCQATADHSNGTASAADFGVSQSSGTFPDNQDVAWGIPSSAETGVYSAPVTVQGLFSVPDDGSVTFYFLAQEADGSISVRDLQLTLLYFPSSYGIVTPTTVSNRRIRDEDATVVASKSAADVAAEQAESSVANQARIERELERMRTEIERLRQDLKTW
jgi:hypothetical protein